MKLENKDMEIFKVPKKLRGNKLFLTTLLPFLSRHTLPASKPHDIDLSRC